MLPSAPYAPIELVIILESLVDKQVTEQLADIRVIGFLIETESTSIVQKDAELGWEAVAK